MDAMCIGCGFVHDMPEEARDTMQMCVKCRASFAVVSAGTFKVHDRERQPTGAVVINYGDAVFYCPCCGKLVRVSVHSMGY